MVFSERCEATRAPTTEDDTTMMSWLAIEGPSKARKISPRVRLLRRARIRLAAASATHSRHSNQAIQAVNLMLILPSPRPRSFALSVTTSLYSIIVSQAFATKLNGEQTSEYSPTTSFGDVGASCTPVGSERGRLGSSSPREAFDTPLTMPLKNPWFLCRSRPRHPQLLKGALNALAADQRTVNSPGT